MRRLAFLLVLLVHSRAAADLKKGEDLLLHGDYAGAAKELAATKGKDAPRAQLALAELQRRIGDYTVSEKTARALLKDKAVGAAATVALAQTLVATGRHAEARPLLEDLVKRSPGDLRARLELGLLADAVGDRAAANRLWTQFYDDYDDGKIDQKSAPALFAVAMATWKNGGFQDANDVLGEVVSLDGNFLEANLAWGRLLLEKYNAAEAAQCFNEVLAIDPAHPDAHAGLARVKLEQSYDYLAAQEEIRQALAVNPRHAAALAVRAELEIDNVDYAAAEKTARELLAVDPGSPEAHTVLAAVRFLKDDRPGYEAAKKAALQRNPRATRFFRVLAEFADKAHRYEDAIALLDEAIAADPKDAVALAQKGLEHLRMGDEKKGLELLERSWKGDPFNVRAYNTLNLYDEVIPKDYVTVAPTASFSFRFPKDEEKVLGRYVPRTLEAAFAEMARRYGFVPKKPVIIELYADPEHYSVRTIGLPNLGALGICFGQVITSISPSTGNVNWGMVLWHELGHIFAVQLSKNRVPRWFTEGLSEYETILARKEWRRENDGDVYAALAAGTLPSVVDLDTRFLRARSMDDMVVAYHMSSLAMEYLATTYGFPKIVDALKLFAQGKTTADAIVAITGKDVAAFDAAFRAHLEKRLAAYKASWRPPVVGEDDVPALEKEAAARPKDAEIRARLALAYLAAGDEKRAGTAMNEALALDKAQRVVLFAVAELALAANDLTGAAAKLQAVIDAGGDGYVVRMRLAQLAKAAGDEKAFEEHLRRAEALEPEKSEPAHHLALLYEASGRADLALAALERYVYLEQMDYPAVRKLLDLHRARKDWAKVREIGEIALYISPEDGELHLGLGEAYREGGKLDAALYELESALGANLPRPALAHVAAARIHLVRKDTARARASLVAALKLEPKNAEALELQKQLGAVKPPAKSPPKPNRK